MPAGRPTGYDPEYCNKVIEWGKLGKSRTWIACELGICKQTLYNWAENNTEFLDALTLAKQFEQRHWEDLGEKYLTTQNFSQNCWSRNMAARFPEEWRESKNVDHSGKVSLVGSILDEIDGDSKDIE